MAMISILRRLPVRIHSGANTHRKLHTSATMSSSNTISDWSAKQYLKFASERARPVTDLLSRVPTTPAPRRIVDLGCGPATSTAFLTERFPDANVSGVDSSPDMLRTAREKLPGVEFTQGDVRTWKDDGADLIFSNAVFHWLRSGERIPTVARLVKGLKSGGVLAMQVPANHAEPSHRGMRDAAAAPGPWKEHFARALKETGERPDLEPVEPVEEWYDALIEDCERVDVWTTVYGHSLGSAKEVVEWVKGTGLRPFMDALPEGEVREAWLKEYERRVAESYGTMADGRVLLRYPRLFVVAVRK